MGIYQIAKNTALDINLAQDINDNGWTVDGGLAIHHGCNQGFIELLGFPYIQGIPNKFKYVVQDYSSGGVNIKVGDTNGINRNSNGEYSETFTPALNDKVSFYSDGNLSIKVLTITVQLEESNAITFAFNEKTKTFVTWYSFSPEFMLKFIDKFITFKAGVPWKHNENPIHNNFYGVQYKSIITFYVNTEAGSLKNFFSMRINGSNVWSAPNEGDIKIYPIDGKKDGMLSRLKKDRFKNYQGKFFADFLRNMADPRFINSLDALFKGAELQGDGMEITIENNDTFEVRLVSVEVEMDIQNYTL